MKKRFLGMIAVPVILFAMMGVTACAKSILPGGEEEVLTKKLDAVSEVTIVENLNYFDVRISAVEHARNYKIECGDFVTVTQRLATNLRAEEGFTFPADGFITLTVTAQAKNYLDSDPKTITYQTEGVTLEGPTITALEDNKLTWESKAAVAYTLKVNGKTVGENGIYTSDTLDLSKYDGKVEVEITPVGDNVYFKTGPSLNITVNAAHDKLMLKPVTDYSITNGVLSWEKSGTITKYKVVDLDMNVKIVEGTTYDMSDKNLVYGVYPIAENNAYIPVEMQDAPIEMVNMPYLDGIGTQNDPYIIKDMFDLRAVDYYESIYEQKLAAGQLPRKNHYKIVENIDYNEVAALESDSNIYTLAKPFYGVLDGNNKTLSNIRVMYDGGYWALFDLIVAGATVSNITFDSPQISNVLQSASHPLNASIATVANVNRGTISGIIVTDAEYTAAGGEVSGIASHNYGLITKCKVSGKFTQASTKLASQACYEMAGIAVENNSGGMITGNTADNLTVTGTTVNSDAGNGYNNVRTSAGIVAVNRAGAQVIGNTVSNVKIVKGLVDYVTYEFGGLVAYNAGTVTVGTGTVTSFSVNGQTINVELGTATDRRGKYVGKNDGTCN